jgi:exonuclease SbcC
MIIKNIKLNNIRSYTDASIDFPESSVLLAGDIGSGKSSVLLALEFALFGLSKSELSGESLLRKGKNKGAVEVSLNINNRHIVVKRTLKKTGDKVVQDSGYIIENDAKKEGTAVELKSRILNLLGYPKEALTRKSLIYRYTVYTPQEEMKRILLDDSIYRMDTLRKVFGIDRYKRIRENTSVFLKELREKKSNYEGQIQDVDVLRDELKEIRQRVSDVTKQIDAVKPEYEQTKKEVDLQKHKLKELEQKAKEKQEITEQIKINEAKLHEKLEQRKRDAKEIELIDMRTEELDRELGNLKIEKPEKTAEEINKIIYKEENELLELACKLKEIELKNKSIKEEEKQIITLSRCPTCRQEVGSEYKEKIKNEHKSELENLGEKFKELTEAKNAKSSHISRLKDDSYNAHKKTTEYKLLMNNRQHIISTLEEIRQKKILLGNSLVGLKEEIGKINMNITDFSKKLGNFEGLNIEEEKSRFDLIWEKFRSIEVRKAGIEKEKNMLDKEESDLKSRIAEKEKIRGKIKKVSQYHSWLNDFFIPLTETMEKHVMAQLHREFNSLFQEWFDVLLDDENVSVRLDDEFSPVVEQNGYEIELANMSGGEKTAISLTYRLALNKVINNLIQTINTNDLLILDEPTDGFSSEQLDRMRDVLDKLGLRQIIIVSHESKIESFAENTIRISKNEHISSVA